VTLRHPLNGWPDMKSTIIALALGVLSAAVAEGQGPFLAVGGPSSVRACPPLSPSVIDQLLKGMAEERALREALRTQLKSLKTAEQFKACEEGALASPEGQKLYQRMMDTDGKSQQEIQAIMAKIPLDLEALITKTCGPDPAKFDDYWKEGKLREAELKGAEKSGFDKECYDLLKERVLPFCKAPAALRTSATVGGVKIPGVGKGEYGYTAEEAKALNPRCAELVTALEGIL